MNRFKKTYRECLCLVSSGGFVAGCIYPIVGWNNGLHVITEDKNGEPLDYLLHNGGGDPVENEYGITGDLAAVDDRFYEEQGNLIFRTLVDGKIDTYPWELEQKGGAENETDA